MKQHNVFMVIAGAALLGGAAPAAAHIQLMYPPQRTTAQKDGPCGAPAGMDGSTRGATATTLEPGSKVTVMWDETIDHPGHFRISFDADGEDDFVEPLAFDDFYTGPSVIADDIADTPQGGVSGFEITLPDIECDNCTLQVIQVMTDRAQYNSNALYYQCADVVLARGAGGAGDPGDGAGDPATPTDDPSTPTPTPSEPSDPSAPDGAAMPVGGGCQASGGEQAAGIALAFALMLLGAPLRRRLDAEK